jgi:surface antigen
MSSFEDRSRSLLGSRAELKQPVPSSGPLPPAGENFTAAWLAAVRSPDRAAGFPDTSPARPAPLTPAITRSLTPEISSVTTRSLPTISPNTSKRFPVVIKGEMKKPVAVALPPHIHKKRRTTITVFGMCVLFLTLVTALVWATPLGGEIGLKFNPQQTGSSLVSNQSGNVSAQAQATAAAIYNRVNDGYDPYAYGGQQITDGKNSLPWPYGQCTYWANSYYHKLTGYWVAWSGNADQWVAGARAAGWDVALTPPPSVPSIIVMMPYTQGSSGYGHVAVVTGTVPNSNPMIVHTSNMNWWANGGGWGIVSEVDFTVGPGVYFVWHPAS